MPERLEFLAASSMDPVDAQAMREAAGELRRLAAVHDTIATFGLKRIAEMTRDDLIAALNAMCRSYTAIARANMSKDEVPVFHEDMDLWNEKLAEWFGGNRTA